MRRKIIVRSGFLGRLRSVWAWAFPPEPRPRKRRERQECLICGKYLAVSNNGRVWKHKCEPED